jgi:hypothetical protein
VAVGERVPAAQGIYAIYPGDLVELEVFVLLGGFFYNKGILLVTVVAHT